MAFTVGISHLEPESWQKTVTHWAERYGGQAITMDLPFDYLIVGKHHTIGVERKAGPDFLSSLIDGRLYRQCREMRDRVQIPIVGVTDHLRRSKSGHIVVARRSTRWEYDKVMLKILSLNAAGIAYVTFDGDVPLAMFIARAGVWASSTQHLLPRRKVYSFEVLDPRLGVLASLPGIGEKTAQDLLDHYGSLAAALGQAGDWDKVPGIGPVTVAKVQAMLQQGAADGAAEEEA